MPRLHLFRRGVTGIFPLLQLALLVRLDRLKVDAPPLPAGDVQDLQLLVAPRLEPVRDSTRDEKPFALTEIGDKDITRSVELDAPRKHVPRRIEAGVSMKIGLPAFDYDLDANVQSAAVTEVKVLLAAFGVPFREVPRRVVLVNLERIFDLLFVHVSPPDDSIRNLPRASIRARRLSCQSIEKAGDKSAKS